MCSFERKAFNRFFIEESLPKSGKEGKEGERVFYEENASTEEDLFEGEIYRRPFESYFMDKICSKYILLEVSKNLFQKA